MELIQLFIVLFSIFKWVNKFAPFHIQLLCLTALAVIVYLLQYSFKCRNTQHASTIRDCTGRKDSANEELIFSSIKKNGLRTDKKFVDKDKLQLGDIAVDVIFYLSVLTNAFLVFICYGVISHCREYPGGTGYAILAVYYFGFFIWCITICQVVAGFILFFQNSSKRFQIWLPGLIISVAGFLIFNYNLILVLSD